MSAFSWSEAIATWRKDAAPDRHLLDRCCRQIDVLKSLPDRDRPTLFAMLLAGARQSAPAQRAKYLNALLTARTLTQIDAATSDAIDALLQEVAPC
jgi:hypothetical protein